MNDALLVTLVSMAESESEIETDVTLLIGGFLVSGFVVSTKKYMEHHHTTSAVWEVLEEFHSEMRSLDVVSDNLPNYIHLRDAKFYAPGGHPIPRNTGIFWRGSLESIHGFSFGVLSEEFS